ncbi:Crp/Fnr family transcriptional regulator [Chitinophaga nivalis]|uniref:Crp/Fnr family transcriptional regulator n=1 Tax=Chitinophaga nivalis TaxID=2991709 RepID=A0ABT3IKI5_9BACT|nr:Crp/Fnr family transcriptional regulator [Chitinophaga nivalis]MCW3465832.1 Crp/Fnr family transcriptional regulator [Chitinophaga nivalis]MCW3484477.1 Crp/Fnr family transcriptional regulator [Chitinophaga nivalis]
MDHFWSVTGHYYPLSASSRELINGLLQPKQLKKNAVYLREGNIPQCAAFVSSGLLAYFYTDDNGQRIIKKFFPEHTFIASMTALLTHTPGDFMITALEDTHLLEFRFQDFLALVATHHDIAMFYIRYLESNWVVAKESLEISLKQKSAGQRYYELLATCPDLAARVKQHHIAAYLGITPTQLSRIRAAEKNGIHQPM